MTRFDVIESSKFEQLTEEELNDVSGGGFTLCANCLFAKYTPCSGS